MRELNEEAEKSSHLWRKYDSERKRKKGFPDPISRFELIFSIFNHLGFALATLAIAVVFGALYVFIGRRASAGFLMLYPLGIYLLVALASLLSSGGKVLRAITARCKRLQCPICEATVATCTNSTLVLCQQCHNPLHLGPTRREHATRTVPCPYCSRPLGIEEGLSHFHCDDCGAALTYSNNQLQLDGYASHCPVCGSQLPKDARVCSTCLKVVGDVRSELFFPFYFEEPPSADEETDLRYALLRTRIRRSPKAHLLYTRAYFEALYQELLPSGICNNMDQEVLRGYRLFVGLTRTLESLEVASKNEDNLRETEDLLSQCDSIYPKILAIFLCHTKLLYPLPLVSHGVFSEWEWVKLRNYLAERIYQVRVTTHQLPWASNFLSWKSESSSRISIFSPVAETGLLAPYTISDVSGLLGEVKRLDPSSDLFIREFAGYLSDSFPVREKSDELGQLLEEYAR